MQAPGTLQHADLRAFRKQHTRRLLLLIEHRESRSVQRTEVRIDGNAADRIGRPARMQHPVLRGLALGPLRVTPVMLGDELLLAARSNALRNRVRLHRQSLPHTMMTPLVPDRENGRRSNDAVAHRQRSVRLLVQGSGQNRDRRPRNELAQKHDTALARTIRLRARHVETEVYLRKASMEGDCPVLHANPLEEEANKGNETPLPVKIQFQSARQERTQDGMVHLILRHDELAPGGSKKGAGHGFMDLRHQETRLRRYSTVNPAASGETAAGYASSYLGCRQLAAACCRDAGTVAGSGQRVVLQRGQLLGDCDQAWAGKEGRAGCATSVASRASGERLSGTPGHE